MSEARLQDARAVAYRALSLGALLQRAEWELALQTNADSRFFEETHKVLVPEYQEQNRYLYQWLEDEKITPHLSSSEAHLLNKALGTWSERTLKSVSWRVEALGMMLWTLQRLETPPPYDQQFDLKETLQPLDLFEPTIDFIWLARLRPQEVLWHSRDEAEFWNWRSRVTELQNLGVRPPEGVTFREIIRDNAQRAVANGLISELIEDDVAVLNKSYAQLNDDEYRFVRAITYERYCAFNWICELSSDWVHIPID